MKKNSCARFLVASLWFLVLLASHTQMKAQTGEWKVWVKVSPCSGRFDWITVAKEDPAPPGGNSSYFPANFIFPGVACTQGCTFLEASNVKDKLRKSPEFFKYCCRDYSVWKNVQTGKMTVLLDKGFSPGEGWILVKGNLCCEEAESVAGIPGACSGHQPIVKMECPTGSGLKYNPATGKTECMCPNGKVWNSTKTACIDPDKTQAGKTGEWKVWVKTSPCSGRTDWLSVAKEDPGMTSGNSYYSVANAVFPNVPCTIYGCTFEEANKVKESLKSSPEFFKYCCRDYSVWKNVHTGKMTVLLDRGPTPGEGWQFMKGNLCCEEAEALAGIPGACSAKTDNLPYKCPPGSYLKWNQEKKKNECDCKAGLVWNKRRTACVDPRELVNEADCSIYPGSIAKWNSVTQKVECDCPEGKTWNSTRTACVDPQDLVREANCTGYPGSIAVWSKERKRVECDCPTGKKWNNSHTACEDADPVKNTDCSGYPGSVAVWSNERNRMECDCPTGKVWNSTHTACVTKTTTKPGAAGTWTLVSVTTVPATPGEGWTFNIQGGSASRVIYNGDKASYQWSPPPQQFDGNGFTMSVSVTATPVAGSTTASVIDVGASGLTSNKPKEQSAYAKSPGGSASNSFTFTPTGYSDVEVWVVLNWGSVKCYYKYKRN